MLAGILSSVDGLLGLMFLISFIKSLKGTGSNENLL